MNGQAVSALNKNILTKKKKKNPTSNKFLVTHNNLLTKLSFVLLASAIIFTGIFGYQKVYTNRIYPKLMVAGIKIGGLTFSEAKTALENKAIELNEIGPEITYNGQTVTPKLDEMGVSFNTNEVLAQLEQYGRQGSIYQKIKDNVILLVSSKQLDIKPIIDEVKFDQYLSKLAKTAEKDPVNAGLEVRNGLIYLTPSEKGHGLDKEKLKEDLTNFINSGENGNISMITSDLEPKVKEEGTTDARAQAENFMNSAPINVTFEDKTWTADRNEIGVWIKFKAQDNKLIAYLDPSSFINSISQSVEIAAKDKEIEDGTGKILSEGQDGRGVDKNTLTSQLTDAVESGKNNATFALITFVVNRGQKTIYPHAQPGRYEGRYIDINLSEQTLYAFEGTTQVNSFLVSTGKRGYATPTGEFHVYGQNRYALMDGPDYYLPNVPFVSWFHGDYSIHGTYWHHNFGHVMSHGCVNMETSNAEWVYNFVSIGTPVYIHY